MTLHTGNSAAFTDLATRLTSQLILPEDTHYEQARQIWNAKVQIRPAAIVRSINVQDVIETVRWAGTHSFPLSVRGGGHDYAGRALRDQGIVIDLSLMKAVSIDPQTRTARVQGGATASELILEAQKHGLVATTGTCSGVGLAGFTLGGGYGPLNGAYGLAVDNLLSAQVVTAAGELVTANAYEHTDLFWGLRGGGGNFGVVVALEYRLYPHTTMLGGLLLYPLEQAKETLQRYNKLIATAPDELTVQTGFMQTPDGQTILFIAPTYSGPEAEREHILALLDSLGQPMINQVEAVDYNTLLHALDPIVRGGRHYYIQTQSLYTLTDETIDILIEQARAFTSPFSMISIHNFHGAASRVEASATAFALRQNHLMFEFIAAWEQQSADEAPKHVHWAQNLSQAFAPYAIKGGYINLLDTAEEERISPAFGANYERLRQIKLAYDPNDMFSSAAGHVSPLEA